MMYGRELVFIIAISISSSAAGALYWVRSMTSQLPPDGWSHMSRSAAKMMAILARITSHCHGRGETSTRSVTGIDGA